MGRYLKDLKLFTAHFDVIYNLQFLRKLSVIKDGRLVSSTWYSEPGVLGVFQGFKLEKRLLYIVPLSSAYYLTRAQLTC